MTTTTVTCVVDSKPEFYQQCAVWLESLNAVDPDHRLIPIVFHVGAAPASLVTKAAQHGAEIVEVAAFGDGAARYCNKLQQHAWLVENTEGPIVLTDVDLFCLQSPADLVRPGMVRAKIVDIPNPDEAALEELLRLSGLPPQALDAAPSLTPGRRTHRLNCNGGLYVLDREMLARLWRPWRKWALFCLERTELLGRYHVHADQLGFMLAMIETGLPFDPLPMAANFPTHFSPRIYEGLGAVRPLCLHYHRRQDASGRLLPTGAEAVDAAIARANAVLDRARREREPGPQRTDPETSAAEAPSAAPASAPARRKLVLHVGLPKTGSSALQSWLHRHGPALRAHGLVYPDDIPAGEDRHQWLVPALRRNALDRLAGLLAAAEDGTMLLSSEGLSNHLDDFSPDALAAFRDMTAGWETEILLVTRAAEPWLRSYYAQCVINPANGASELWGTTLIFEDYARHPRTRRLVDHAALARDLAVAFGAGSVVRLDYEQDCFGEFLRRFGLADAGLPPPSRTNESVPGWVVPLMLRINRLGLGEEKRRCWRAALQAHLGTGHSVLRQSLRGDLLHDLEQIDPTIVAAEAARRAADDPDAATKLTAFATFLRNGGE